MVLELSHNVRVVPIAHYSHKDFTKNYNEISNCSFTQLVTSGLIRVLHRALGDDSSPNNALSGLPALSAATLSIMTFVVNNATAPPPPPPPLGGSSVNNHSTITEVLYRGGTPTFAYLVR